jgi:hypothetical protein
MATRLLRGHTAVEWTGVGVGGAVPGRVRGRAFRRMRSPPGRAGYALWMTIEPPAMFCGLAVSMSIDAPLRLSKTVAPFFVTLIRKRS